MSVLNAIVALAKTREAATVIVRSRHTHPVDESEKCHEEKHDSGTEFGNVFVRVANVGKIDQGDSNEQKRERRNKASIDSMFRTYVGVVVARKRLIHCWCSIVNCF